MTTPTIETRVALGIQWLDENHPDGKQWRDEVDPTTLDLASAYDCVLGQAFWAQANRKGYDSGYDYVFYAYTDAAGSRLTTAWMIEHGFEAAIETYTDLRTAWVRLLTPQKDD